MKRYKKANEGIHAPEEVKEKAVRPHRRRPYARWTGAVAAVLAVVVLGGIAMSPIWPNSADPGQPAPFSMDGRSRTAGPAAKGAALAVADYPEMHPYPRDDDFFSDLGDGEDAWKRASEARSIAYDAWREDVKALRSGTDYTGLMDQFLSRSTAQFLTGAGEENRICSPLNVYMALSMLAETAGENSRQQILDLLQVDSIEALRDRAAALWKDHYRDDGTVTSILGNSLWLRSGMTYSQKVLDILAKDYYASSFSGEMGSEEYDQALRDWLNEQTGGLLAEQAEGLEMKPETVLALASTIYFKAAWEDGFDQERTETGTFHAPGGDVDADFMRRTLDGAFYWGDDFTAAELRFQEGGGMWLILPAEGTTVDQLLESGQAMDFLLSPKYDRYDDKGNVAVEGWTGQKYLTIHLSMPKFDVSSDLDLIDGLKELGVTDVFDGSVSNFDPLGASTDDPLYVSQAKHAARVKVDEEGCEAAAYTVMMVGPTSAAPPNDEVDFTLDRPFLFAVTGDSGLPLFTGVVNQPNG
ncbi:MAG: serpin family protein [Oscillospiraceae bacterium]|nr:serpin family protein [Oscillospiraceae bacterium]